jgi:hypothetical protein
MVLNRKIPFSAVRGTAHSQYLMRQNAKLKVEAACHYLPSKLHGTISCIILALTILRTSNQINFSRVLLCIIQLIL